MLSKVPRPVLWLGFAGLIPFAAGAAGAWLLPPPWNGFSLLSQIGYGVTILSFLGAVHWGLALAGYGRPAAPAGEAVSTTDRVRFGLGVVPALVGWIVLAMPPVLGLMILIVAFPIVLYGDERAVRAGLAPDWYPALRRPLTALVVLTLVAGLVRLLTVPAAPTVIG